MRKTTAPGRARSLGARGAHERAKERAGERGSAYVVVLLVLLLLTIFGLGLSLVTQTEMAIGTNQRDATRAFYAAESGIAVTTAWMWEGNHEPHNFEVYRRQIGNQVVRDVVDTTRVLSRSVEFSDLSNVANFANEEPTFRHNYSFDTTARRVVTQGAQPDRQIAQKRTQLMVEMDPWNLSARRDLRDDSPIIYGTVTPPPPP